MWFKNLILYRFTQTLETDNETLETKLAEKRFRPCGSQDTVTYGWVSPLGEDSEMLTHVAGQCTMITACKEEKILPASVIREHVEEKVQLIEAEQGRQVFRKEKESIKEEVIQTLLPRAFTRRTKTFAYIDRQHGWMIVDAGSFKKAEEMTAALRQAIGSLPVVPPALKTAPTATMTQWIKAGDIHMPTSFSLGDECDLRDPGDEGGIVRARRMDLGAEEITHHLEAGKLANRLALSWNEDLSFVLGEDLIIRRLKFGDLLQEQAEEQGGEDRASQFDADFSIMHMTLARFLGELVNVLGGEVEK
ncbi:recombination-associated protein RdgC [Spongorhabdus nitratireducens]